MQTIADKDGDAEHEIAPFSHKKSRSHHRPSNLWSHEFSRSKRRMPQNCPFDISIWKMRRQGGTGTELAVPVLLWVFYEI
jgi:hypothetical protein